MNIIKSDKRSDILKQKADYEKNYQERKSRYEEQSSRLGKARSEITDSVTNHILKALGPLADALNIEVRSEFSYNGKSIDVRVLSNEYNMNGEGVALSWNYSAEIDRDGNLKRETGSWSGLNAVTEDQVHSLEMTISALKILNDIDWYQILNQQSPSYEEYITEPNPDWEEKPNFDSQLRQLDLEEAIGTNTLFKARMGKIYNGQVYYRINKVSGVRYYLTEYPARKVEQGDFSEHYDTTMNYNTLMQYLITPYQTVEATE